MLENSVLTKFNVTLTSFEELTGQFEASQCV
jgi:hypothetical protein